MNCKHRYEQCDDLCCVMNCHSKPSERGCVFEYYCSLDDYPCDENCEEHVDTLIKNKLKAIKHHAYTAEQELKEINKILQDEEK